MDNLSFEQLDNNFRNNNFPMIEADVRGMRFLKLRSMSRRDLLELFCQVQNIDLSQVNSRQYFKFIFEMENIEDSLIDIFIRERFEEERINRRANEEYLIDQLRRLQNFDWGGSHGNSLEKNIVDNYVKKIQSYERINEEIEGNLLHSLRGYTLNSWYNHWTSILIEDVFKDHVKILPTVGLVKKIDFFINGIPFDLKVTYFPEQFMKDKLKECGYGNELTQLKRICRSLGIYIPTDLRNEELKNHLYNILIEDQREEAKTFIRILKETKKTIISNAEENPTELKIWLYENQGEARFDASNRFFLVLVDENDLRDSWKLKRNIPFIRSKINEHFDDLSDDMSNLDTSFYWASDQRRYNCKSDLLFVKYSN